MEKERDRKLISREYLKISLSHEPSKKEKSEPLSYHKPDLLSAQYPTRNSLPFLFFHRSSWATVLLLSPSLVEPTSSARWLFDSWAANCIGRPSSSFKGHARKYIHTLTCTRYIHVFALSGTRIFVGENTFLVQRQFNPFAAALVPLDVISKRDRACVGRSWKPIRNIRYVYVLRLGLEDDLRLTDRPFVSNPFEW